MSTLARELSRAPLEDDAPKLPCFYTREEFIITWAFAFLAITEGYENAYPLDDHASPGTEHLASADASGAERIKRATRYLVREAGVRYHAIEVHPDGRLSAARVVEPRNILFWARDRVGRIACDPPHALAMAARELSGLIPTAPLLQAIDEMGMGVARAASHGPPADLEAAMRVVDQSLAEVGVARLGGAGRREVN